MLRVVAVGAGRVLAVEELSRRSIHVFRFRPVAAHLDPYFPNLKSVQEARGRIVTKAYLYCKGLVGVLISVVDVVDLVAILS